MTLLLKCIYLYRLVEDNNFISSKFSFTTDSPIQGSIEKKASLYMVKFW